MLEKLGVGVLALGVPRPIFGPSELTPLVVLIALPNGLVPLSGGDYVLGRLEDE